MRASEVCINSYLQRSRFCRLCLTRVENPFRRVYGFVDPGQALNPAPSSNYLRNVVRLVDAAKSAGAQTMPGAFSFLYAGFRV